MKLVVGLGNPGRRYQGTRHNIGFDVLAATARRLQAGKPRQRFEGEWIETEYSGERLLLLCPLTFMNLSGQSVVAARDFYRLPNADLLVVCDDFQLTLGRLRFRPGGSGGGQKGLEDVVRHCGPDVPRLRLGIGPVPPNWDPADFVLGKFASEQATQVQDLIPRAVQATLDWVALDTAECMNRYNGPPEPRQRPATGDEDRD
jgi:peptidyl-tRNA hydrolase, PTH1 family